MTTRIESLKEEYVVFENPNYYGQGEHYFIAKRSNFETMPYCDTFDSYGQKISHSEMCGDDEDDHWEVKAFNYWDGSNWKTVLWDDNEEWGSHEVDDGLSEAILKELPEYPYIDGIGEEIETENYTYYYTRYPSPWICSVE